MRCINQLVSDYLYPMIDSKMSCVLALLVDIRECQVIQHCCHWWNSAMMAWMQALGIYYSCSCCWTSLSLIWKLSLALLIQSFAMVFGKWNTAAVDGQDCAAVESIVLSTYSYASQKMIWSKTISQKRIKNASKTCSSAMLFMCQCASCISCTSLFRVQRPASLHAFILSLSVTFLLKIANQQQWHSDILIKSICSKVGRAERWPYFISDV